MHQALEAEQLRRGRKRKSDAESDAQGDWTEAEDVNLLEVVWSGARGEGRKIATRGASACKQRLQLVRKHMQNYVDLHKQASPALVGQVLAIVYQLLCSLQQ